MKKLLSIILFIFLLFGSFYYVNASTQSKVTKIMNNFYSKLDKSTLDVEEKINKLELLNNRVDSIKKNKWNSLSNNSKELLKFIELSINSKIIFYKKELGKLLDENFICGELNIQCIKAPCNPIKKTFSSKYELEKSNAKFLYKGKCVISNNTNDDVQNNIPYYFVAIHNEALPDPTYEEITLEKSYVTLTEIIEKADSYNIKLTLMFNPQWVDYIKSDSSRLEKLKKWKQSGHEISAHHHSVKHPNWNGYTNTPENEATKLREYIRPDHISESYLGNMDNFVSKLQEINPDMNSGCVGKNINMPDIFIYDTCSGVANSGELGIKTNDTEPSKGINEYISIYTINGIERKYLAHAQITTKDALLKAKEIIESMDSIKVYGAVAHSIKNNPATDQGDGIYLLEYLDFLHEKDPHGLKSKTITEIIEAKILPEKEIVR